MPRIRTIKPDAFKSDTLSSVPRGVRWTFAGLWTYADDAGRARDDARLVKAELYPLDDDMSRDDVEDDLRMLAQIGGICRYEVNGKRYFHMPGWEHQKINRPTPSRLPECPKREHSESDSDSSLTTHGGISEDSPPERKGKERGNGTGSGESAALALTDAPRPDVDRLCQHLVARISANGGNPKPGKKWHDAARLMLDNDGRTEADIHAAIDWCQDDEFWRANILSMPKLREKYDQLRLQAQRRAGPRSRQQETDDLFDRAAVRMGVIQGGQS